MTTKKTEGLSDTGTAMYRSGVAARLAGVPVETLRVWERRYGIVGPRLSEHGQRLYSAVEIQRLALIKQLVDMGHAVGTIASLATEDLLRMRTVAKTLGTPPDAATAPRHADIALVGPLVSLRRFELSASGAALRVVARCASVADAARELQGKRAEIVIIELATLNEASVDAVAGVKSACNAEQALVLYRFAPSVVIRRLRAEGHEVARAPSDAVELETLCRALMSKPPVDATSGTGPAGSLEPPSPRFDERALSELAGASNTMYCECPRHIVELVLSLGSFESYSKQCANRGAEDAALHLDLQLTTARARALMEEALVRVALAEGLPLPAIAAGED